MKYNSKEFHAMHDEKDRLKKEDKKLCHTCYDKKKCDLQIFNYIGEACSYYKKEEE